MSARGDVSLLADGYAAALPPEIDAGFAAGSLLEIELHVSAADRRRLWGALPPSRELLAHLSAAGLDAGLVRTAAAAKVMLHGFDFVRYADTPQPPRNHLWLGGMAAAILA